MNVIQESPSVNAGSPAAPAATCSINVHAREVALEATVGIAMTTAQSLLLQRAFGGRFTPHNVAEEAVMGEVMDILVRYEEDGSATADEARDYALDAGALPAGEVAIIDLAFGESSWAKVARLASILNVSEETLVRSCLATEASGREIDEETESARAEWQAKVDKLPVLYRELLRRPHGEERASHEKETEKWFSEKWEKVEFPSIAFDVESQSADPEGPVVVRMQLMAREVEDLLEDEDQPRTALGIVRAMSVVGDDSFPRPDADAAWFGWGKNNRLGMIRWFGRWENAARVEVEIPMPLELYQSIEKIAALVGTTPALWILGCFTTYRYDPRGEPRDDASERYSAEMLLAKWMGGTDA